MITDQISVHYGQAPPGETIGDLTKKQYEELDKVAKFSPGYSFVVLRYPEYKGNRGSRATHILVWHHDSDPRSNVGLVTYGVVQYFDQSKETERVVRRIAHRVYRFSGFILESTI